MREKEQATTVIYLRHGETDFPIDRIYCDKHEDPPLNGNGSAQARSAAAALADVDIDAVYASPCQRTQMTAALALEGRDLKVNLLEDLRERHFGIWEGLYFSEIEARYPDEYLDWKRNQAAFSPEGGESVFDLLSRARGAVNGVLEQNTGKTILIVAHVGPIRALLCEALNMPVAEYRRLMIDYASMSCVNYGRSQNNLIYMNLLGYSRLTKC